jgi:uncharacterized protein YcbX
VAATLPAAFGDDRRMSNSTGRVAWIAIAPVKSMALVFLDHAHLGLNGIAGDRAFAVIDEAGHLVNGKRVGTLALIRPEYDAGASHLSLRFPNGDTIADKVTLGEPFDATFFGHPRGVRRVEGPWSEALSSRAGRPVRLVALASPGDGADRGPTATLLSTAALASLARAGGSDQPLDRRRFRMTFGIDGVGAYAEDAWLDREVRVGGAVVRPVGNVGRCAVTTQDPDTGIASFDTLRILQATRGHLDTTEPLPFGIWADVVEPGDVSLGDAIEPI